MAEESTHLRSSDAEKKAVLWPRGTHRANGFNEILGNSGRRSVYDNHSNIEYGLRAARIKSHSRAIKKWSDKHIELYFFGAKSSLKGETARGFEGTYSPYGNEAHHLIPYDFQTYLSANLVKVIKEHTEYNVNNGKNIIFLPRRTKYTIVHRLPWHCGSHSEYSDSVIELIMDLISDFDVKLLTCGSEENKDIGKKLESRLEKSQQHLWDIVVNCAQKIVDRYDSCSPDIEREDLGINKI